MKASELIALADELVENPFSDAVKIHLINSIERRIHVEVLLEQPTDVQSVTADNLENYELTLDGRDELYLAWMRTMYYWNMAEREEYQNEKEMFDSCWEDLCHDVAEREHQGSCGKEYTYAFES